jgi:hypothetical protein
MKKLMFLAMVCVAAASFAQDTLNTKPPITNREHKKQDDFTRKNIIGKWKDQNSTISFYLKGTYATQFDSGAKDSGYWEIKKSKLILTTRPSYFEQTYKLIYFSKTEMKYQAIDSKRAEDFVSLPEDYTIWIARKIANFDK